MFKKKIVEKIKTHILSPVFSFLNRGKILYSQAGHR
jgi:hypothetical protein